jgi:ribosomal protein S18 acetylase RimI-like enzyme
MTTIRCATQHDIPHLAELIARDADWVESGSTKLKVDDTEIRVAEQDGYLVGFIVMRVIQRGQCVADGRLKRIGNRLRHFPIPRPDSIVQPIRLGFIENVFVTSGLRRQGIGTALVQSCNQWLQRLPVDEMQTAVGSDRVAARDFFGRLGFEPIRVLMKRRIGRQEGQCPPGIRPANRQDLPQLAELVRREIEYQQQLAPCFQLVPRVNWAGYVSGRLQCRSTEVLVAEKSGHLMGYTEIRVVRQGQGHTGRQLKKMIQMPSRLFQKKPALTVGGPNRLGFIEDIYVQPSLRNRSVGFELFKSSLRWFEERDIQVVEAAIWIGNEASQNFFSKLGFTPQKLMMRKKL